jgi:hypothetical protein
VTASARARSSAGIVPPQHGAWAFLGLPLLVGIAVANWAFALLVLAAAWISAYPWSYFVLAVIKEQRARHPRPERFHHALLIWSAVALPALALLVVVRPWLVWFGIAFAMAFVVNAAFALRHDDRALVNDAVFVLECVALVPIAWAIGASDRTITPPDFGQAPRSLWILTAAVALLLVGSILHVRSLIRERSSVGFARMSLAFAIISLVASVLLAFAWGIPAGLFLVLPFAWCVGRSVAMRGTSPAPTRIGMVELVGFCLLAIPSLVLA